MLPRQFSVIREHGLSPSALCPQDANLPSDLHADIRCHVLSMAVCFGLHVSYGLHRQGGIRVSKHGGISKGGCLFISCLIVAAVDSGIHWFRTGHLPTYLGYEILGFIGISILADAEQYFLDIKENTEEIQKQVETLTGKVDSLANELKRRS